MIRRVNGNYLRKSAVCTAKNQIYKDNHVMFGLSVFFSIISGFLSIMVALILKEFIDTGLTGLNKLMSLVIIAIGFILINIIVNIIEAYVVNRYASKAMVNVNSYFNIRLLDLRIRKFNQNKNGKYLSLINNDLRIIEQDYVRGLIFLILQSSMVLLGLSYMIYLNLTLTIIVMLSALLPLLISVFSVKKIENAQKEVSVANGYFTSFVKDYLCGFPVIKSFHIEAEIKKKSNDESIKLEITKAKYQRIIDIIGALSQNSTIIMVIILFLVGAILTMNGEMTIGGILAFVQLLNNVTSPITQVIPAYSKYNAAQKLMAEAEQLTSQETEQFDRLKEKKAEFRKSIEIKDVSFRFKDEEETIISNINIEFQKNKSYAIVGLSGSGKSTLLKLLAGHLEGYDGQILIDGVELRSLSEDSVTNLISLVQQEAFIFDDTIEENIKLYQDWDEEQFQKAIEGAVLKNLICERGGVKTHCGENGYSFSGGERQRIAIARALLKESPVLLLDEVTSALDLQTTHQLEHKLGTMKHITKIAITHKLDQNVLKQYDQILFMRKGQIVEQGHFDELLNLKGEFYSVYRLEAENEIRKEIA